MWSGAVWLSCLHLEEQRQNGVVSRCRQHHEQPPVDSPTRVSWREQAAEHQQRRQDSLAQSGSVQAWERVLVDAPWLQRNGRIRSSVKAWPNPQGSSRREWSPSRARGTRKGRRRSRNKPPRAQKLEAPASSTCRRAQGPETQAPAVLSLQLRWRGARGMPATTTGARSTWTV